MKRVFWFLTVIIVSFLIFSFWHNNSNSAYNEIQLTFELEQISNDSNEYTFEYVTTNVGKSDVELKFPTELEVNWSVKKMDGVEKFNNQTFLPEKVGFEESTESIISLKPNEQLESLIFIDKGSLNPGRCEIEASLATTNIESEIIYVEFIVK